jgi:hypothetical protein
LVQHARYVLGLFGPDGDLRRPGPNIAERGGKNDANRRVTMASDNT